MAEPEQDTAVVVKVGLPADAYRFLRCMCSNCGLEFKRLVPDDELHDVLAHAVEATAREAGLEAEPSHDPQPSREVYCAYCAHRALARDFVHPEHSDFMRQTALRDYVQPLIDRLMSPLRALKGGLLSVEVSSPRLARPIAGPEPNDMARIRCLQCDCRFKIRCAWRGLVFCPECGCRLCAQ